MHDVSIIIVNYNGKRYIDKLFESLERLVHDGFSYEVIFVDNNSSDDSVEYLRGRSYKLDLNIVCSDENRGFAGGNNYGVARADGRYVVFLNNDTQVNSRWLKELYSFIENNDCGMVNSKLLFFYDFIKLEFKTKDKIVINRQLNINGQNYNVDSKFCKNVICEENSLTCFGHSEISVPLLMGTTDYEIGIQAEAMKNEDKIVCCNMEGFNGTSDDLRLSISRTHIVDNKYSLIQNAGSGIDNKCNGYDIGFGCADGPQYDKPYEINNGCGAAIIMKKQDFLDCGGFDDRFFMYYEDTDLSYRLKSMGKKIMYCPTAIVRHIHTGSSTEWSDFFLYHVYRNKLLFVWKDVSRAQFFKYYLRQMADGLKNHSIPRIKGTNDALKIVMGFKNIHY